MNWTNFLNDPKKRQLALLASGILVVIAFLFTRLFAIKDGLFFLNDMGRDFLVLWDWKETFKPPLLGPQNSVLPFNQSALYFYWLMPSYLLSGQSYYASIYTLIATYLALFTVGMWKLRKHAWWPSLLLGFVWLITLHPTSIEQHRFVWNPSFLAAFLLTTVVGFWQYRSTKKLSWLAVFGIATGVGMAFSYSLAPVFLAVILPLLFLEKWNSWKYLLAAALGTLATHLPTLAFEARHKFLLTKAVISWFQSGANPDGTGTTFTAAQKLSDLFLHVFGLHTANWQWLIAGTFFLLVVWHTNTLWQKTRHTSQEKLFLFVSTTLWITLLLTFVLPIGVHAHYIFGIATLFFLSILTLPQWKRAVLIMLLTFFWILPQTFLPHFKPAQRTVGQMKACAQQVCAEVTEPVFVSLESGILPFHNGPDWRYMFISNGCDVQNLETTPQAAQTMLVTTEFSEYVHGETDYHELSLFGSSEEVSQYTCTDDITVHVLQHQ